MTLTSAASAELRRWGWQRTGGFARYAPLRFGGLVASRSVDGGDGLSAWPGAVPRWRPDDCHVDLGAKVHLARGVRLHFEGASARITIGDGTHLGPRTEVRCRERIDIGADCRVSWDVQITDTDYHHLDGAVTTIPVVIEDHVWIGMRVTVLKGVHVGRGAVIAAGAMVVADVPAGALVAGLPAKVVRSGVRWTN